MIIAWIFAQWFITPYPTPPCTVVLDTRGDCRYWFWNDRPEAPNPCAVDGIEVVPERCYVASVGD